MRFRLALSISPWYILNVKLKVVQMSIKYHENCYTLGKCYCSIRAFHCHAYSCPVQNVNGHAHAHFYFKYLGNSSTLLFAVYRRLSFIFVIK